jgi:hypothetical protein
LTTTLSSEAVGPSAADPLRLRPTEATLADRFCSPTLEIRPWRDPVVDRAGYDPRSSYVEQFWLPVLGPSTIWLLRRFASYLEDCPSGLVLETAELARQLGIGDRSGQSSPFNRTLKRCVDFEMARWDSPALAVRRHLPPLADRHLRRLPEEMRLRHERLNRQPGNMADERLKRHARRLALSLLDYGEDQSSTEAQLIRWGFDPILARECAVFGVLVQARRRASQEAS